MKNWTICKGCYNKNGRENINNSVIENEICISHQQPKFKKINNNNINSPNVPAYENHRHVFVGTSNVGKTYFMLKILEKSGNKRPIHLITRSPNQYPNYETSINNKPIDKIKGSVATFVDMLGTRNSSQIDEFFTRGKQENLDVYYISQSYFG